MEQFAPPAEFEVVHMFEVLITEEVLDEMGWRLDVLIPLIEPCGRLSIQVHCFNYNPAHSYAEAFIAV